MNDNAMLSADKRNCWWYSASDCSASKTYAPDILEEAERLTRRRLAKDRRRQMTDIRRQKEAKAARKQLQPAIEKLAARAIKGTVHFKRGDIARILKISPAEAGKLLRTAQNKRSLYQRVRTEGDIYCTKDGWWHVALPAGKSFSQIANDTVDSMVAAMAIPARYWESTSEV